MICFDRAAPTRSLLLAAPPCTARLHRRTAEQHHLDTGYIGDMNAAMTMSLCHIDLASGHIQQSIPAGQMFAQGAFEGVLELRKEKSRDAARSRRGKENYEFYELAKMLPLPPAITSQLDKASIIRLSISYLKLRDFSSHGDPPWTIGGPAPSKAVKSCANRRRSVAAIASEIFEMHQGTHILQSLDGFGFTLANDGRFLYISETVSIYLGLSQVDMMGSCIFDYVHPEDHQELADHMGLAPPNRHSYPSPDGAGSDDGSSGPTTPRATSPTMLDKGNLMNPASEKGIHRCFCVRMKSTLTKRGVHVKCSGYRVVQILIRFRSQISFSLPRKHPSPLLGCVGLAIALPPPTITELLLTADMFVTRLSPDLNVIYCEPRLGDMVDLQADDITNQSLYSFCHVEDLQKLRKSHSDLLLKGQVLTDYYRLMLSHGGWVWVQTCATVMCNVKNIEEQNIIAVNYVLSGSEYAGCVMNMHQMKRVKEGSRPDPSENDRGSLSQESPPLSRPPESPRGQEMAPFSDEEQRGQKRKHSSQCLTDTTSLSQRDYDDGPSAFDITAMFPQQQQDKLSVAAYSGHSFSERLSESRNSRRKMDRPKKRRHSTHRKDTHEANEQDESIDDFLSCGSSDVDCVMVNSALDRSDAPRRGSSPELATPERNVSASPSDDNIVRHSPAVELSPSSSATAVTGSGAWLGVTTDDSAAHVSPSTSSSVRELEEVMNKHLPGDIEHLRTSHRADCSHPSQLLKHKSAIQWVGGSPSQPGLEHLPATNLLRSFYTSRESVIRSTVYSHRTPQYYSDMQPSLLTPPGGGSIVSDAYKDMVSPFAPSQMSVGKASAGSLAYNLMAAYPSNPINVSMAASLSDSYGLATPPSSVSPQDSYSNPFTNQLLTETPSGRKYRQFCHEASGIPIKPQAYPHPAHAALPTYEHSKTPTYYGNSFGSYGHISSPTPAHYHESGKNRGTW